METYTGKFIEEVRFYSKDEKLVTIKHKSFKVRPKQQDKTLLHYIYASVREIRTR